MSALQEIRPQWLSKRPKPLLTNSVVYTDHKISNYLLIIKNEPLLTRPEYQREIAWTPNQMKKLLDTIMFRGYIPPLIIYNYPDGEVEAYYGEVLDGQHRLGVMEHFRNGNFIVTLGSKKPVPIYWTNEFEKDVCIFYEKNDKIEEWGRVNKKTIRYFVNEEKKLFDSFKITIGNISNTERLTHSERIDIFRSLQEGRPVRNSDLLKLYHNLEVIRDIQEVSDGSSLSESMKKLMSNFCKKDAKKYWVHWIVRFILASNNSNNEEKLEKIMLSSDTQIAKYITKGASCVATFPEDKKQLFTERFNRFESFLKNVWQNEKPTNKLGPFAFFRLFSEFFDLSEVEEYNLSTNMSTWISNQDKNMLTCWFGNVHPSFPDDKLYLQEKCYRNCRDEFALFKQTSLEKHNVKVKPVRKTVPKKTRKTLFDYYKDENGCVTCEAGCLKSLSFEDDWEASHVVSVHDGGGNELDNLRVCCQQCNRDMGTMNLYEYKINYK
jgi:5-methylcytosine-specific restriction endonuclease McrA